MSQPFRLPQGGSTDRSRALAFTFDGLLYQGYAGDTLASALIANGLHLVGRSFKYHRPRGILTAGAEEPNALVSLAGGPGRVTPNLRATQIELYDGLRASSQNRWPSLKFDLGAVNDMASPLFGAGFYYKTFMGPNLFGKNWAWTRLYEPMIRRAAGLGAAPTEPDPDRYQRTFDHCDVLIIGGGPAGLAAALAASRSGARVVLCDENPVLGGSRTRSPPCVRRQTCGLCRARRRSVITRRTSSRSTSASPKPTSSPIPTCRANAYGRCARERSCWRRAQSSDRSSLRTMTARP
jgi:sarcosine oxidase, subunit alpha